MSVDWKGTVDAIETMSPGAVPPDLVVFPYRASLDRTAIAIVGLHTRGKSVLFNRLVGTEICAVSTLPATVSGVLAASGEPEAWGELPSGERVELSASPAEFRQELERASGPRFKRAFIRGDFRLPPNLILIDTPGTNDPDALVDERMAGVSDLWRTSGASGAVAVVAAPPGVSGSDLALLHEIEKTFGSSDAVVLKRTSSDVTRADLEDIRIDARSRLDVELMVLLDDVPEGSWGTGPLSELEMTISEAAVRHADRLGRDERRLRRVGVDVGGRASRGIIGLATLREAISVAGPDIEPGLLVAMKSAEASQSEAEMNRKAAELVRGASIMDMSMRSTLIELSSAGASPAQNFLAQQVGGASRQRLGRFVVDVVDSLPDEMATRALRGSLLSLGDLVEIGLHAGSQRVRSAAWARSASIAMSVAEVRLLLNTGGPAAEAGRQALIRLLSAQTARLSSATRRLGAEVVRESLDADVTACLRSSAEWVALAAECESDTAGKLSNLKLARISAFSAHAEVIGRNVSNVVNREWYSCLSQVTTAIDRVYPQFAAAISRLKRLSAGPAEMNAITSWENATIGYVVDRVSVGVDAEIRNIFLNDATSLPVRAQLRYLEGVARRTIQLAPERDLGTLSDLIVHIRDFGELRASEVDEGRLLLSRRATTLDRSVNLAYWGALVGGVVLLFSCMALTPDEWFSAFFVLAMVWIIAACLRPSIGRSRERRAGELGALDGE